MKAIGRWLHCFERIELLAKQSVCMATYYISKDNKGEFYWTLESDKNGRTICMSSESYDSKQGAKSSIIWNQNNGSTPTVIDLTEK